jgi:hypothetical protein
MGDLRKLMKFTGSNGIFFRCFEKISRKKIQMQGAQILRNEAYREVRCSDEG